ncbi:hypothetical protein FACS1894219_07310 [Clostridia bacterium]|nr:hypothetical protein FACS1894219_07310 [Clostridia bacterium]
MSHFTISCTTCSLRGASSDEVLATFEYAPKAGYFAWGIAGPPLWNVGGWRWFDGKKVKRMADDAGLHICTEVYGPGVPNDKFSEQDVIDFAGMFEVAVDLESPLVVMTGRGRKEGTEPLDYVVDFLNALDPKLDQFDAMLALEPHYGSQLQTADDYRYIFSRIKSQNIGITVDTGHFYSAGVDIPAFIREFGDNIINVHLKDHIGKQSVPIGTGEIPIKEIVKALDEIDYEGALAVEIEPEDPPMLPQYCRDALVYLRGVVKEVTGQNA